MTRLCYYCLCFSNIILAQDLPAWVLHPLPSPEYLFGVGISNRYHEQGKSHIIARQNAVENITRQVQVFIIAGLAEFSSGNLIEARDYVLEFIDSTTYYQIEVNAVQIDSFISQQKTFSLLIINRDLSKPEQILHRRSLIRDSKTHVTSKAPLWIQTPPRKEGYLYGIGIGVPYRNESDCWDNSAKIARLEVAKQIEVHVESLESQPTKYHEYGIKWLEETVKISLKGATIKERWHDDKRNLYYTLVEYKYP